MVCFEEEDYRGISAIIITRYQGYTSTIWNYHWSWPHLTDFFISKFSLYIFYSLEGNNMCIQHLKSWRVTLYLLKGGIPIQIICNFSAQIWLFLFVYLLVYSIVYVTMVHSYLFYTSGYNWMKSESVSHLVISDSLRHHGLQPARLLCPWGFSSPEHWSELPCPSPGDLPNPGTEPRSPTL